jgi:hypothetical protein
MRSPSGTGPRLLDRDVKRSGGTTGLFVGPTATSPSGSSRRRSLTAWPTSPGWWGCGIKARDLPCRPSERWLTSLRRQASFVSPHTSIATISARNWWHQRSDWNALERRTTTAKRSGATRQLDTRFVSVARLIVLNGPADVDLALHDLAVDGTHPSRSGTGDEPTVLSLRGLLGNAEQRLSRTKSGSSGERTGQRPGSSGRPRRAAQPAQRSAEEPRYRPHVPRQSLPAQPTAPEQRPTP